MHVLQVGLAWSLSLVLCLKCHLVLPSLVCLYSLFDLVELTD
jgi:hypothetical protein